MRIRLAHEYSLILAFALQDKKTYLSNIIYIDNVSSKKKKTPPRYLEILNYDTLPTSYPSALHLNTIRTLHHNALHLRKNPLPKTPLPIPPHKKIPPHPPHPHSRNHNPDHRPPPPQHPPHHPRRHNRHRNGTSPTHYPLLHLLPPSSSPSLPTPHLLSHPHPSKIQTHNLTLFPSNQGIKSLLFLLYQHLTSPPHRLARFHSLKTNTVLAGLEIVFWAVVFGLSCSGVAQGGVCEGAHCGLGAVVIVLALGIV